MPSIGVNGVPFWQLVNDSNFENSDNYGGFYPRDTLTGGVLIAFGSKMQ